jgi:hypothetical protein
MLTTWDAMSFGQLLRVGRWSCCSVNGFAPSDAGVFLHVRQLDATTSTSPDIYSANADIMYVLDVAAKGGLSREWIPI